MVETWTWRRRTRFAGQVQKAQKQSAPESCRSGSRGNQDPGQASCMGRSKDQEDHGTGRKSAGSVCQYDHSYFETVSQNWSGGEPETGGVHPLWVWRAQPTLADGLQGTLPVIRWWVLSSSDHSGWSFSFPGGIESLSQRESIDRAKTIEPGIWAIRIATTYPDRQRLSLGGWKRESIHLFDNLADATGCGCYS